MQKDQYICITKASTNALYKDKGSKFFGYAYPVTTKEDILLSISFLKEKHPKAQHFCYAWQLGKTYDTYKVNDDGEPKNSAGIPIYNQLKSFHITNSLVVVVRYFGGTKLGVSGLIKAYKSTAKMAIENAKMEIKTINNLLQITCSYDKINEVMRIVKEKNLTIVAQVHHTHCIYTLSIRQNHFKKILNIFESLGLQIEDKSTEINY